jgi:hypothetical protein
MTAKMFGAVITHLDSLDFLFPFCYAQVIFGKNRIGAKSAAIHFAADSTVTVDSRVRFSVQDEMYFSAGTTCLIVIAHDLLLSKIARPFMVIITYFPAND